MTAQQPTKSEIQSLVSLIQSNTLLNRQLQSICQINGLKGSGVKADLQRRIVELIYQCERDRSRFQQIKSSIESIKSGNQYYPNAHSSAPPLYGNTPVASRTMSTYSQSSATYPAAGYPASGHSNSYRPNSGFSHHASRVTFKPSPFYEPKALVADVRVCDAMAHHRNTVAISLKAHELGNHLSDPSIRIFVFCSTADTGVQDIAFPYQSDLKVNGGDVKANLRGLKNKPGSTRPVDITDQLRLRPAGYINNVEFTYALTDKGRVPSKKKKETQVRHIRVQKFS
ncbi:E3 SUMO-protein ligase pli1 [Pyricularia oryzae]